MVGHDPEVIKYGLHSAVKHDHGKGGHDQVLNDAADHKKEIAPLALAEKQPGNEEEQGHVKGVHRHEGEPETLNVADNHRAMPMPLSASIIRSRFTCKLLRGFVQPLRIAARPTRGRC